MSTANVSVPHPSGTVSTGSPNLEKQGQASEPPGTPTYADVELQAITTLRDSNAGSAVISNHLSAFRGFMSFHGKTYDCLADATLSSSFDEALRDYLNGKSLLGRKPSTLRTRGTQLRLFHRIAKSLLLLNAELDFNAALKQAMGASGFTIAALARAAGLPTHPISNWTRREREPYPSSWGHISRIEQALGLHADSLASRCSWYVREKHRRSELVRPRIAYREKMRVLQKVQYRLQNVSEPLRSEWLELLEFKTDLLLRDDESRLEQWTLRPREQDNRDRKWYATVGNQQSPTAENVFHMLSRYWGYLCLPECGLEPEKASLANIVDAERVNRYLKWLHGRMGEYNKSALSILGTIRSLVRPKTGFIWHRTEIGQRALPDIQEDMLLKFPDLDQPARWRAWCEHTHARLRKLQSNLVRGKHVRQSRSTSEPIQLILSDPKPSSFLARALSDYDKSEPPRHHKWCWPAHQRNGLIWAMLLATAVRSKHIGLMTYSPDNSGNLYRRTSGAWALRFERGLFKNFKGAAAERDYDVELPGNLWPRIERYLLEARPLLSSPESPYFFRPQKTRNSKSGRPLAEESTYNIVREISTTYIPECAGFGPHAFRHIIGTDWLKSHPRDYMTVALILHDKLETVLAEYVHLEADDGMRAYADHVEKVLTKKG